MVTATALHKLHESSLYTICLDVLLYSNCTCTFAFRAVCNFKYVISILFFRLQDFERDYVETDAGG